MIFPARPKPDPTKWHRRFAWLPITLLDGRTAWLQEVEVKRYYWQGWRFVAREIGNRDDMGPTTSPPPKPVR